MRPEDIKVGHWYMLDSKYPAGPDGPIPVYVWAVGNTFPFEVSYHHLPQPDTPGPSHLMWYHSINWFAKHCLCELEIEWKRLE